MALPLVAFDTLVNTEQVNSAAQPERPAARTEAVTFHGSPDTLFRIYFMNLILTVITFGFYRFWGEVQLRRYLFNQTEFNGDRFAYHGTAGELFFGSLKVGFFFLLPLRILTELNQLPDLSLVSHGLMSLAAMLFSVLFRAVAIVGARRYRLSRTSWRGIRFSFHGRTTTFIRQYVIDLFLTVVTFGLYYPIFTMRKQQFLVPFSYFGNQAFEFTGQARDLYSSYVGTWLVSVALFTLGVALAGATDSPLMLLLCLAPLSYCWCRYFVIQRRYCWNHTSYGSLKFRSHMTPGAFFLLNITNLLLLVVTLGLAWPWITVRNLHFAYSTLTTEGQIDPAQIQQQAQNAPATGEGFADLFNMELDLA